MNNYWENRYKSGGNSGEGSYGDFAKHKAEVINNFIKKYEITTISDYGCGDGNQISLLDDNFESYHGYDISETTLNKCRSKFSSNTKFNFYNSVDDLPDSELSMSLDVIYHIIDEGEMVDYLKLLFSKSKKYVILFTSNHNDNSRNNYMDIMFHRIITDYIEKHINGFELIEIINNNLSTSAKFLIYKKI